jgi:hypothetical protein
MEILRHLRFRLYFDSWANAGFAQICTYILALLVTSGIQGCLSSLKNSLNGCGAPSIQPPARMYKPLIADVERNRGDPCKVGALDKALPFMERRYIHSSSKSIESALLRSWFCCL